MLNTSIYSNKSQGIIERFSWLVLFSALIKLTLDIFRIQKSILHWQSRPPQLQSKIIHIHSLVRSMTKVILSKIKSISTWTIDFSKLNSTNTSVRITLGTFICSHFQNKVVFGLFHDNPQFNLCNKGWWKKNVVVKFWFSGSRDQ